MQAEHPGLRNVEHLRACARTLACALLPTRSSRAQESACIARRSPLPHPLQREVLAEACDEQEQEDGCTQLPASLFPVRTSVPCSSHVGPQRISVCICPSRNGLVGKRNNGGATLQRRSDASSTLPTLPCTLAKPFSCPALLYMLRSLTLVDPNRRPEQRRERCCVLAKLPA